MKRFLIIDNNQPQRNTIVITEDKNNALSEGASILKTTNIRAVIANENTLGSINSLGFRM